MCPKLNISHVLKPHPFPEFPMLVLAPLCIARCQSQEPRLSSLIFQIQNSLSHVDYLHLLNSPGICPISPISLDIALFRPLPRLQQTFIVGLPFASLPVSNAISTFPPESVFYYDNQNKYPTG